MPRFRMRNDEVFMKHAQKWIAGLLVLALAAGFSGCTQPQTPSQASSQAPSQKSIAVGDWLVEPYLEAACITGIREDSQPQDAQQVFSHLAIQTQPGGGWQYLNAVTGRIFPQKESAAFVGMTFFGTLPFSPDVLFPGVYSDYTGYRSYAQQIKETEGIDLDTGAHGGVFTTLPVLAGGQWFHLDEMGPYLYPASETDPVVLDGEANVALFVDTADGNWQAQGTSWGYVGAEPFHEQFILADANGQRLSDAVYESAFPYQDGVAAVCLDGKWGYVDTAGNPVTEFCYEPLVYWEEWNENGELVQGPALPYSANEGLIPVKRNGLCGVIDTQGNEVIPCRYEDITSVYAGRVWAKENGKWGVLNVAPSADPAAEERAAFYRALTGTVKTQARDITLLSTPQAVTPEEAASAAGLFPQGYAVVGKLPLSQPVRVRYSAVSGGGEGDASLAGIYQPGNWNMEGEPDTTGTKNPTVAIYGRDTLLCEQNGVLYLARPFGMPLVMIERLYVQGDGFAADAQTVYLARGEYENGGFVLSQTGSVPVVIDKNGEVKITEEEYNALYTAWSAGDEAAVTQAMQSLLAAYDVRAAQTVCLTNADGTVQSAAYMGAAQEVQATDEQKEGALAVFRQYYLSYLNAINELDGSLTEYCTESQRARQEERIWRFNKDHTFENQALLLDEESFVLSEENGVLTARYNIRCENRCWLRETGEEQELNVALQQVTAEYHEEKGVWYIASSILDNTTPMNEAALRAI